MDALPPDVIARVGAALDAGSRNACFFAAACLRSVHETTVAHRLRFSGAALDKFDAAARIVRHVLALMPRLASLTVAFNGFANTPTDACARFRECMRGLPARVAVLLEFKQCAPAFVRDAVWDRACSVSLNVAAPNALNAPAVDEINAMLDAVDVVERLVCGPRLCGKLPSATLDRIRIVDVVSFHGAGGQLDLRNVDPRKTVVRLTGDVLGFDVLDAHKIWSVVCSSESHHIRLRDALVRDDNRLKDVRILVINDRVARVLTDIVNAMPPESKVGLLVSHPAALPFLDALPEARAVVLFATRDATFVAARMVQLLLPHKKCGIRFAPPLDPPPAPVASLRDAYERLLRVDRDAWYFVKYFLV